VPAGLALGALACGDTLVDSAYSGVPRFTLQGVVGGTSDALPEPEALVTTAMFWSPMGPTARDYDERVEQLGTASAAPVPRPYVMNLFDEPGPQHLYTTPSGAQYALGRVVAYLDTNRDGFLSRTEAAPLWAPGRYANAPVAPVAPAYSFDSLDANRDGFLSRAEAAPLANPATFDRYDGNRDGFLSRTEADLLLRSGVGGTYGTPTGTVYGPRY
jgi:hypothetical protein